MIRLWFDFIVLLGKCGKPFPTGLHLRMTCGNIIASWLLDHRRCGKKMATGSEVPLVFTSKYIATGPLVMTSSELQLHVH